MAEKLNPRAVEGSLNAAGLRFGIVVSRFNSFITDRLLAGALDALGRAGASDDRIELVRVPGSFEIPVAAKKLADSHRLDAIICIGCVLRGETSHYEYVANEVARGIQLAQMDSGVPMAFCVLTCDTLEQAIDRAGLKSGNKGFESGLAAIEMASLSRKLRGNSFSAKPAKIKPRTPRR
jgi:6,7-dimethyl-8-ribityllumazine synthase